MRYRMDGRTGAARQISICPDGLTDSHLGKEFVILRTTTNGPTSSQTRDEFMPASQDHGSLEGCGLATAIRTSQHHERVGMTIRPAEIQVEPVDPTKVANRK